MAGETVVVAAASGAVGSVVGLIAKIKVCNFGGIAGGAKKCRHVMDELAFDPSAAAICDTQELLTQVKK